VRSGGTRITGSFPYKKRAVLSDGGRRGRPHKEEFEVNAFAFRVEDPKAEIHLLVGHDFGKPLASKLGGSLKLRDAKDALHFQATISAEVAETTHGRDALALLTAGLATGISPGFRMPPERAVPREEAEAITEEGNNPEKGEHRAIIRTIKQALLFELSVVTSPAYPEAQIEARNWTPGKLDISPPPLAMNHRRRRWPLL
jgi:Escherichia/Staphylococcus phage prohead protease